MTPIQQAIETLGKNQQFYTAAELYKLGRKHGLTSKTVHVAFINNICRVKRGLYDVRLCNMSEDVAPPTIERHVVASRTATAKESPVQAKFTRPPVINIQQKTFVDIEEAFIPQLNAQFVPWGEYAGIKKIIESRLFCPTFISGLSGNGKTLMVSQACAALRREYIRIQISPETDESDLIGGFRLIGGETVFYKGPVIKAMERGAVLLIDELDRGSNKILCLQGILEGEPVLIKKIGQVITPAPGFTIIATANTKGRGSEDGRFSGATIIDEAFIERFVITIDQPYPDGKIEKSIIANHCVQFGVSDDVFVDRLVAWAQVIRKTYEAGGIEDCISTRRLCHIIKTYSIFNHRLQSISKCIARFDDETRSAFNDLYTKIDIQSQTNESIHENSN